MCLEWPGCEPGSPPRARGTHELARRKRPRIRFIPAGAGNTVWWQMGAQRQSVHPRGRGEHGVQSTRTNNAAGSSPRARGTRRAVPPELSPARFIPAGAGNTAGAAAHTLRPPVHPRGRGEHWVTTDELLEYAGSSPRARGTPEFVRPPRDRHRFIPAGAGNTRRRTVDPTIAAVHPRGRGEHARLRELADELAGSSPRARGTLEFHQAAASIIRFIPAGAGNTSTPRPTRAMAAVHPRGRGEHLRAHNDFGIAGGSSPRARGTRSLTPGGANRGRFIPAGAGNTRAHLPPHSSVTVHPRGRGEHFMEIGPPAEFVGSSPRARGTLWRQRR